MAKFLTTVGNSFYIEQIILNAETRLTLVTPYLNLSRNLIDRLADADRENIKITLIYGKNELNQKERNKIRSFNNIEIFFCKNLHAKCYLNEDSMIITSMNLYEFSERNNREMGILIEKDGDNEIFQDALKEIESIKNASALEQSCKNRTSSQLIYLSDEKNERWDYFYPSLYRILNYEYKDFEVQYDNNTTIQVNDFPVEGVDLRVTGRIEFSFEDNGFYRYLKENFQDKIQELFPGIRFYWRSSLKIYFEKEFVGEVSIVGLNIIVTKYWKIIENTKQQIIIAMNSYDKDEPNYYLAAISKKNR